MGLRVLRDPLSSSCWWGRKPTQGQKTSPKRGFTVCLDIVNLDGLSECSHLTDIWITYSIIQICPDNYSYPSMVSCRKYPFMSRLLIMTLTATTALGLWDRGRADRLLVRAAPILDEYQVWRVVTSWMYEPVLVVSILIIYQMLMFLPKFQFKNSTPVLLNDYLVNAISFSFGFALLITILSYLLGKNIPGYMGAFGYWINFLYKYSYGNRNHTVPHLPLSFKYYPWLVFLLCCVASQELRYDGLFGLLMGVVECYFFNSGLILFTLDTYTDKEEYASKIKLTSCGCWLHVDPNKIKENKRLTVSSAQFYLDLENEQEEQMRELESERVEISQQENWQEEGAVADE